MLVFVLLLIPIDCLRHRLFSGTRQRTSHASDTAADTLSASVAEQPTTNAGGISRRSVDALLGIEAVPLAAQDSSSRVDARPLRTAAHARVGMLQAGGRGEPATSCAVYVRAENAQGQTLPAATKERRRSEGADGSVGIKRSASSALARGGQCQDRGVIRKQIVCRSGHICSRMPQSIARGRHVWWNSRGGSRRGEWLIKMYDLRAVLVGMVVGMTITGVRGGVVLAGRHAIGRHRLYCSEGGRETSN